MAANAASKVPELTELTQPTDKASTLLGAWLRGEADYVPTLRSIVALGYLPAEAFNLMVNAKLLEQRTAGQLPS